ncbi:hypothetical protein [Blastococcus sp. SYSU D00813]
MTVSDPRTIDAVARSADGLLVLAVTEDRPYTAADTDRLAEELRVKLNGYVYALRSGQVPERRDGEPAAVVLSAITEPPAAVREVLEAAGQVLAADGVTVTWRLLTPPGREPTDVLRDIAAALIAAVPDSTARIRYRATAVGPVRRDGFHAVTGGGNAVNVPVPGAVRDAVEELKQVMWTPEKGTWLEVDLVLDRADGRLEPGFNYGLEPAGEPLTRDVLVAELRSFPRPPEAVPAWMAERIG